MSYAIFRSEPIYTLADLAQIGSHNKREKKAYQSNPDIDISKTKNNIEIVPLSEKYIKGFYNLTKEYKKEHDKRMETTREDRKKTFKQMLDSSNNVVADELLFTSDKDFFKGMSKKQILKWANTCMDFVYKDLGYTKEQVLHATVHMDETTPHLHCVVVPLIKKFDKRINAEKYTISKKHYIKDKAHLSELQDKYYERLIKSNFKLERGIKNSDNEHIKIKEFKKITKKLNSRLEQQNYLMTKDYEDLEEKLKFSKPTMTGKDVKIDKETYDTLKRFMNTSKNVIEDVPNNQALFNELNNYTNKYRELEKDNKRFSNEIDRLEYKNQELQRENSHLKRIITTLLDTLKLFFHKILNIGNEKDKDTVVEYIANYYENKLYTKRDLYDIADKTPRENEIEDYLYNQKKKNKDKGLEL